MPNLLGVYFLWGHHLSRMKTTWAFLLVLCCSVAVAQTPAPDSLSKVVRSADSVVQITKKRLRRIDTTKIDPRKVTLHSALVPGWGQLDVKQWWLVPGIYGGFGVAAFSINYNQTRYKTFVGAYKVLALRTGGATDTIMLGRRFKVDQLRIIKDGYRRNRELSILSVLGIWGLQIIEANVTAHLKTFDVSEDLSLKLRPNLLSSPFGTNWGLTLEIGLLQRKRKPLGITH